MRCVVSMPTQDGNTALDDAEQRGHTAVLELLSGPAEPASAIAPPQVATEAKGAIDLDLFMGGVETSTPPEVESAQGESDPPPLSKAKQQAQRAKQRGNEALKAKKSAQPGRINAHCTRSLAHQVVCCVADTTKL